MEVYLCFVCAFKREHSISLLVSWPLLLNAAHDFQYVIKTIVNLRISLTQKQCIKNIKTIRLPCWSVQWQWYALFCLQSHNQSSIVAASYGFKWRICFPTSHLCVFITWQQEISKTSSNFTVWMSTGTQVLCILLMLHFNIARKVYFSREVRKFMNFGIAPNITLLHFQHKSQLEKVSLKYL